MNLLEVLIWMSSSPGLRTNRSIIILEGDIKLFHCIDTHPQAVEDIVEDDDAPFLLLVLGEAIFCIDQSHLLQDRRLSTFSSSYISSPWLARERLCCDAVGW